MAGFPDLVQRGRWRVQPCKRRPERVLRTSVNHCTRSSLRRSFPASPSHCKVSGRAFFPQGGWCYGPQAPYTFLNNHLSHFPKPVTLHSPSCTCILVQVTSLNLDYITFPLFSCIFLFLSRTQHEPLTKLLGQDLAQHNTVYSSFSRSLLSFLSKFLILYVRSIKQLTSFMSLSLRCYS